MAIVAVILAIVAIALFFKVMADAAKFNEVRDEREEAKKDARRLAERIRDIEGKLTAKSQEVGTVKDQKKQIQEAEAAKRGAEQAKKDAENEKGQFETRNRELSETLTRVRVEKEQQRQELVAARERLRELGETAAQIDRLKAEKDEAVQAANAANRRAAEAPVAAPVVVHNAELEAEREERQSSKLRKDVDMLRKSSDKLEGIVQTWKQKALESESNYRRLQKRFNDSTLLWNTTQSQLDLALDEIHFLRTGAPPEHAQSDKGKKRAALKPGEKPFEIRPGEVVVLPDARPSEAYADDVEPEPTKPEPVAETPKAEPVAEAPKAEPVKAEAPKAEPVAEAPKAEPVKTDEPATDAAPLSKADALKAKLAESKAKAEAARAAKATPTEAPTPAPAQTVEAPKADAPKADEAKPVLRKKEAEPEPAKDAKNAKVAPPRPTKGPAKK